MPPPARRGRSRAAVRRAAGVLVRRLEWAAWPRVYWAGERARSGRPDGAALFDGNVALDTGQVVADRLAGKPAGGFAVRLARPAPALHNTIEEYVRASPAVADLLPLDEALIATSLRRLLQSRRFPAAVPAIVGDVAAWRRGVESAVGAARLLMCGGGAGGVLSELLPEALGIWVGD